MLLIRGFSKVSKKGETKKRREAYAPLMITYRDGTVRTYEPKDFMANGSLKTKKGGAALCSKQ